MMVCPRCGKRYPANTEVCVEDGSRLSVLSDDPYIGYEFAHFKIQERIGRGGFGIVYLAKHVELGHTLAVKILRQQYITDAQLVERFKREARVCSQINHDNVVKVYDFGFDDTLGFYYAMEYLEGQSLTDLMRSYSRGMPLDLLLSLLEQICSALDQAHNLGIVHRDLKPSNIHLISQFNRQNVVKVLDFGIAKVLQTEEGEGVTATGQIVGSPRFMSPEQARGRHNEVDRRSDIYALGIMIFWMLTGRLPFESKQLARLLFMHIKSPPPTLNSVRPAPHFTPELEDVIAAALSKDKDSRPYSAGELYRRIVESTQTNDTPTAYDDPFAPDPGEQTLPSHAPPRETPQPSLLEQATGIPPQTPANLPPFQSEHQHNTNSLVDIFPRDEMEELDEEDLDATTVGVSSDIPQPEPALVTSLPPMAPPPAMPSTLPPMPEGPMPAPKPSSSNPSFDYDEGPTTLNASASPQNFGPPPPMAPPVSLPSAPPNSSPPPPSISGKNISVPMPKVPPPPQMTPPARIAPSPTIPPTRTAPPKKKGKPKKRSWKAILLSGLAIVLLLELLFVGWKLWRKYQAKQNPPPATRSLLVTPPHFVALGKRSPKRISPHVAKVFSQTQATFFPMRAKSSILEKYSCNMTGCEVNQTKSHTLCSLTQWTDV